MYSSYIYLSKTIVIFTLFLCECTYESTDSMFAQRTEQEPLNLPATSGEHSIYFSRCVNVFRNGIKGTREGRKGEDISAAVAVTRTLMNEPGLHAASVGVTHTAAGYAALIGRASRRVCGSFAKRSTYTRLGCPDRRSLVDPRCCRSEGVKVCTPTSCTTMADIMFDQAMFLRTSEYIKLLLNCCTLILFFIKKKWIVKFFLTYKSMRATQTLLNFKQKLFII